MTRQATLVAITLQLASQLACRDSRPVAYKRAAEHAFEDLTMSTARRAAHSDDEVRESQCLFGRHAADQQVLLLGERTSVTCRVRTGAVGSDLWKGEPCTALAGVGVCRDAYVLGVIGSRGEYRLAAPRAITAREELARLERSPWATDAATSSMKRWAGGLEGKAILPRILTAVTWQAGATPMVAAQLEVDAGDRRGPWVFLAGGRVVGVAGPFGAEPPQPFSLDGVDYVTLSAFVCQNCGGGAREVYLLEKGTMRRVLESWAQAN